MFAPSVAIKVCLKCVRIRLQYEFDHVCAGGDDGSIRPLDDGDRVGRWTAFAVVDIQSPLVEKSFAPGNLDALLKGGDPCIEPAADVIFAFICRFDVVRLTTFGAVGCAPQLHFVFGYFDFPHNFTLFR